MNLEDHVKKDREKFNRRLKKLGICDATEFDYPKYLQSTLWKNIRDWIVKRDDATCQVCSMHEPTIGKDFFGAFEVHHRDYSLETLEGRRSDGLVLLCRGCHAKIEFYHSGTKRSSLEEKDAELRRLTELHERIAVDGMQLELTVSEKPGSTRCAVSYIGPSEYTEFYDLDPLIAEVALKLYFRHKDALRIPMPFGVYRVRQKSGTNLVELSSGKPVISFKSAKTAAEIKSKNENIYQVVQLLRRVVDESNLWKL